MRPFDSPRLALLAALLVAPACSAQETQPPLEARSEPAEPQVRPDVNAAYLDPALDVERLARGFASEGREAFAARDAVTQALPIEPGMAVADIGAGTGIYLEPFADAVGPDGTVFAIDIAQPLVDYLGAYARERGLGNVEPVLGETATTTLPDASVDLVFTSDVYHHFERPRAMNAHLFEVLRPGGTYAVLDFRTDEDAPGWIRDHVRTDMATVIAEVTAAGFVFAREVPVRGLEENYLLLFERP